MNYIKSLDYQGFLCYNYKCKVIFYKRGEKLRNNLSENMGNNARAEQINVKEYIKSKLKAFADTFATLGEIIGGTSNVSKLTDAEIEAEKIREKFNLKRIKELEKRVEIPEISKNENTKKREKKDEYTAGRTSTNAKPENSRQEQRAVRKSANKKGKDDKLQKGYEIGE